MQSGPQAAIRHSRDPGGTLAKSDALHAFGPRDHAMLEIVIKFAATVGFFKNSARTERKPQTSSSDTRSRLYSAVSVLCGAESCLSAKGLKGQKLLAAAAPTLPLPACSIPHKCRCRFQKLADRREDGRRLEETLARSVWYAGEERRGKRARRK
jgi:hypothetical protein